MKRGPVFPLVFLLSLSLVYIMLDLSTHHSALPSLHQLYVLDSHGRFRVQEVRYQGYGEGQAREVTEDDLRFVDKNGNLTMVSE